MGAVAAAAVVHGAGLGDGHAAVLAAHQALAHVAGQARHVDAGVLRLLLAARRSVAVKVQRLRVAAVALAHGAHAGLVHAAGAFKARGGVVRVVAKGAALRVVRLAVKAVGGQAVAHLAVAGPRDAHGVRAADDVVAGHNGIAKVVAVVVTRQREARLADAGAVPALGVLGALRRVGRLAGVAALLALPQAQRLRFAGGLVRVRRQVVAGLAAAGAVAALAVLQVRAVHAHARLGLRRHAARSLRPAALLYLPHLLLSPAPLLARRALLLTAILITYTHHWS